MRRKLALLLAILFLVKMHQFLLSLSQLNILITEMSFWMKDYSKTKEKYEKYDVTDMMGLYDEKDILS